MEAACAGQVRVEGDPLFWFESAPGVYHVWPQPRAFVQEVGREAVQHDAGDAIAYSFGGTTASFGTTQVEKNRLKPEREDDAIFQRKDRAWKTKFIEMLTGKDTDDA